MSRPKVMDFESWITLVNSPNEGDRADAADDIPRGHEAEVVDALLALLKDNSALVRACAADSLRFFPDRSEIMAALHTVLREDSDLLARAYAMSSIAEVSNLVGLADLMARWSVEQDPTLRLHAAAGAMLRLITIGTDELLGYLRSSNEVLSDASKNALREVLTKLIEVAKQIEAAGIARE